MVSVANRPQIWSEGQTRGYPDSGEASFYDRHEWCLNPLLTLEDQLTRLGEELDHARSLAPGWQRDECVINVYLLVCGIGCTVDDYLGRRAWDMSLIAEHFPRLRFAVAILRHLLSLSHELSKWISDRPVRRWRRHWARCVDLACATLAGGGALSDEQRWSELRSTRDELSRATLPHRLRRRRLRIPEGFRCQDLSHHDVLALARRFAERCPDHRGALGVIGIRTAGAYFAPLAHAHFAALGWNPVSWLTIRPREGLTGPEQRQLRKFARDRARLVVIDDHPNTGTTLTLVLTALVRCGIAPQRIAILTPRHPVRPGWTLPREAPGADGVMMVTLEPGETYQAQLLTAPAVEALLSHWFGQRGWQRIAVRPSAWVDAVNARLADHCREGFQVRLKRVFEIELGKDHEDPIVVHVVAKSVGWGWLGYHAYLAGTRLVGFVPPVIGLRHGLLFSQWVGDVTDPPSGLLKPVPATTLAAYVARRTQCLRLSEDPRLESHDTSWDGWTMLLAVLRRAYGSYFGRLKISALRGVLRGFTSPHPILVDGRMRPDEWLETSTAMYKLDYEHHNFGAAELDIVDPAYDLATAVFEFGLTEQAESELVHAYARQTADGSVANRVLLYKLLSGTFAMQQAAYGAPRARSEHQRAHWNGRYLAARNFLTYEVHRLCAGRMSPWPLPRWSGPLFFLDLDGVFDCEAFGFPHTTASGLAALALLRAHEFGVILNTGRSVEHVRRYCRIYGLPGGVAEYGSVLVDAVGGREVAFTTPVALEQLHRCRDALRALPGVFLDHEYEYAVRAYRYEGGRTVSLPASEVQEILSQPQFQGLACTTTSADTYIVQRGNTKGTAVLAVKRYLDRLDEPVIAMGDSDQDVAMLEVADSWYAPANCSPRIRALARFRAGRVTVRPKQRGFLEATHELLRRQGVLPGRIPSLHRPGGVRTPSDLLMMLLHAAERPLLSQLLAALRWHRL